MERTCKEVWRMYPRSKPLKCVPLPLLSSYVTPVFLSGSHTKTHTPKCAHTHTHACILKQVEVHGFNTVCRFPPLPHTQMKGRGRHMDTYAGASSPLFFELFPLSVQAGFVCRAYSFCVCTNAESANTLLFPVYFPVHCFSIFCTSGDVLTTKIWKSSVTRGGLWVLVLYFLKYLTVFYKNFSKEISAISLIPLNHCSPMWSGLLNFCLTMVFLVFS